MRRLVPSPLRVASRYLAGTQDISTLVTQFTDAWMDLQTEIMKLHDQGFTDGSARRVAIYTNHEWVRLIQRGRDLAQAVMAQKVAPRGQAKKLEVAARLMLSSRRQPRDIFKWEIQNQPKFRLLIEAGTRWEDAADNDSALFSLGPFTIHNTLGLTGDELEGVKKTLEKAIKTARQSGVHGFERVMYGDVFVVGRLQQPNTLAWYNPSEDTVYVRPNLKVGRGAMHNLIHELGHRYWERFAGSQQKRDWASWHQNMSYLDGPEPEVHIPQPGEVVEIARAEGRGKNKRKPVVTEIRGNRIFVDTGGFFTANQFYQHAAREAELAKYPTRYAATNREEHFCEAMALFALGALPEPHLVKFQEIWT